MPDNNGSQYIQAPDGSYVEFPSSMKDADIQSAMGKLFPSKASGPVQGPQQLPSAGEMIAEGEEAQASGMHDIAEQHPGALAGAAAAGAAPLLGAEGVIPAIGRTIVSAAKNPKVQGAAGGLAYHYLPGWAKSMLLGAGLMGARSGPGGGEPEAPQGESAPAEPEVIQAPEPREPMGGERPGSQFSVPREQLPANVKAGQPGAGEAYRSIGGKIIYTPSEGSDVDLEQIRRNAGLSRTGKVRAIGNPVGSQ